MEAGGPARAAAIIMEPIRNNDELVDVISRRRCYLGIDGFDPGVLQAMRAADRALFAPPGAHGVYEDEPLPIGHGQTCSQPSMVAAMATLLELRPGLRVLEVGTGCGYSAAVCAQLIHPGGRLFSIEFIPELAEAARRNLDALPAPPRNCTLLTGDGSIGLPGQAPFDRIYLTAGVGRGFSRRHLEDQLAPHGILLYPEAYGDMYFVRRTPSGLISRTMHGVGFVQLRGEMGGFD